MQFTVGMVAAHPPTRAEVCQHSLRNAVTEGKSEEVSCAVTFPRENNGRTTRAIAGVMLRSDAVSMRYNPPHSCTLNQRTHTHTGKFSKCRTDRIERRGMERAIGDRERGQY